MTPAYMKNLKSSLKPHNWKIVTSSWPARIMALLFSFSLFFFQFLGGYLDNNLTVTTQQVLLSILFSIVPCVIVGEAVLRLSAFIQRKSKASGTEKPGLCTDPVKKDLGIFVLYSVIICLCWMPFFLAFYPGILAYDVRDQVFQAAGSYITDHPLIHTLMLQGFISLGQNVLHNVNAGVGLYTLTQTVITAASLAYMLLFLYRCRVHRAIRIILLVFICLFPVWPILALSATKDILFADAFLLAGICLAYWCVNPDLIRKYRFLVLFGCSLFFACLLRTGSYAFAGAVLFASIFLTRSGFRIRILLTGCLSLGLAILASSVLTSATQATTLKSNELISLPLQQIAYSFNTHKDEMSEEEINTVYELIKYVDSYNPHSADPIKDYHIDAQGDDRFWQLYRRFMKRYPGDYLAAWLNNTMGLWYIWDTSSTHIYGSGIWYDGGIGYLLTDMHTETLELGIHRNSKFPWLLYTCLDLVNGNSFLDIPVFRLLFSMALYFWIAMLAFTAGIVNGRKNAALLFIYIACYILGILFCPCVLVRYCFPFIICIPVMFTAASQ